MDYNNGLKDGLESGEPQFGAMLETASPILIEILGELGYDWVWIDTEHKNRSPYDAPWLEGLTRAAEVAGVELVVRIPSGSYPPLIRKVLDAGIRNIILPRVETADEVEAAVKAGRFTYDDGPGERGIGFGRSSGYGAAFDIAGGDTTYGTLEDESILIGCIIENNRAYQNREEILSIPELDFAVPGPGDMSTSLGHPLEYGHPDVAERVANVRQSCVDHDLHQISILGAHFETIDDIETEMEKGSQMFALGQDIGAFRETLKNRLEAVPSN